MFYSIKGIIEKISIDYVIVSCGGISYKVLIPTSDIEKYEVGKEQLIFTHFYINSNYETFLFGFAAESTIELFKLLISVSGVGPKTAISILSFLTKEDLITAIKNSDAKAFEKVKGLGKKTSLKIIVDLSSKFGRLEEVDLGILNSLDVEIVDSLTSMGFDKRKVSEALSLIDKNLSEDAKIKEIIKKLNDRK